MSALWDFVDEAKRQAWYLEVGNDLDGDCLSATVPEWCKPGQKRHWTRQDRNRFEYELAESEIEYQNLPFNEWQQALEAIPQCRMATRIQKMLGLYRCDERNIDGFRARAIAEIIDQPTYTVLAPLIVKATKLHIRLLASYEPGDMPVMSNYWNKLDRAHTKAIEQLIAHLPPRPLGRRPVPERTKRRPGRRAGTINPNSKAKQIREEINAGGFDANIAQHVHCTEDYVRKIRREMEAQDVHLGHFPDRN